MRNCLPKHMNRHKIGRHQIIAVINSRLHVDPVTGHIDGHRTLKQKHVLRIEMAQRHHQSHRSASVRQLVEHGPESCACVVCRENRGILKPYQIALLASFTRQTPKIDKSRRIGCPAAAAWARKWARLIMCICECELIIRHVRKCTKCTVCIFVQCSS